MPQPEPREKLFLIDAMSLVFRAFFAPMQAALVSPSGMPTKAIYIFVRTLLKLLKTHQPDYVAVAFDLAAPTFRDELFQAYKANRPAFPEDLVVELPFVRRFCRALGITLAEREGFEADDIIGTLARLGTSRGLDAFIVSGDEDLFQLVNDHVRVVKPSRGGSDGEKICGTEEVKEILGVGPEQVVDWLALTGDPSDNIPGARPLPGQEPKIAAGEKKRSYIGPKGATEIIQKFGTLEKALENGQDETKIKKASYREALRDFKKEAMLSKELAEIRTDVPLDVKLEQLRPVPRQLQELKALCQELGFTSLLREFLEQAPPVRAAKAVEETPLRTREELEAWLRRLDPKAPLAVAVGFDRQADEDAEDGFRRVLRGFGLADGVRTASVEAEQSNQTEALAMSLATVLASDEPPKAVHDSKRLRRELATLGIALGAVRDDTMLYAGLLDPLASSHSLDDVVLKRLGRKLSASLAEAAEATRELAALLVPEVVQQGLKRLYDEIELPLAAVLADIETVGVRLDPKILGKMSGEFELELRELTGKIHELAGGPFDIDSPKQLGQVLFERLKLPGGTKLKKSGQYSTEASVLEKLAAEGHELPQRILDYRTRAKLKSTYIDALPKFIDPKTGRLHTSFDAMGARTGRLSSSNPNLQNIPIGDEFGLRIRSAFVADEGWQLISADYSQIELRVLAHMSEDPLLIEAFERGEDIHARTAQEIFGVPAGLQTHEHRRMAKAINYGVIYGLSSFGLAERTGTSKTEAQRYIDAYFARYRKVKDFIGGQVEEARQSGRVRTLFGRLRPIPEINSRDVPSRNRAEREAMNTPLQGTAADLLKLAMVKAHARLARDKMRTRMILTVHDELVFETPEDELAKAPEIVRAEMEGVYALKVPLRVDLGSGRNWKEAKEHG